MPPSACSKRPRRSASAPVNAPFSWPNSSDSSRSAVNAAVLSATKALVDARAVPMQRARDELLARAGLAGDQHRHAGAREAADGAEHLLHRASPGRAAPGCCGALDLRVHGHRRLLRGPAHQVDRLVDVEGLGRYSNAPPWYAATAASRSECAVMTITGSPGRVACIRLQQLQPAASGHADVGHQHVGCLEAQRRERLVGLVEGARRSCRCPSAPSPAPSESMRRRPPARPVAASSSCSAPLAGKS